MMIAFVLFTLAVFIVLAGVDPQVVDDTFITFQYAQNLVEYGRLTWWPFGEMVDGFTSPGHTLLLASGMALGFSPMGTNMAINLIAMALILMGVGQGTRELKFMPRYLAIGFVSLSAPFIIWYGGGLDGIIYSAVLFWIYLTFENSLRKAALSWPLISLLVLLPVIRPEGLLISPAIICWAWLSTRRQKAGLHRLRLATFAVIAAVGTLIAWRIAVYGYPLPNTYYAKTSASRWDEVEAGLRYVATWVTALGGFSLFLVVLCIVSGTANHLRILFLSGVVALAIVSGGDSHAYARFLMPALPLLALDLAVLLNRSEAPIRIATLAIFTGYITVQLLVVFARVPPHIGLPHSIANMLQGRWPYVTYESNPHLYLRAMSVQEFDEAISPGIPVVGSDVGALAYFSDREIVDAAGLNNKALAHKPKPEGQLITWGYPGLPDLVDRDAEVIYLYFPHYETWSWKQIAEDPDQCSPAAKAKISRASVSRVEMDDRYLCASVPSQKISGAWINFYVHKNHTGVVVREDAEFSNCILAAELTCGLSATSQ